VCGTEVDQDLVVENDVSYSPARDGDCLGPLAGLEKQRQRYADAVTELSDSARTRLVLVARANPSALDAAPTRPSDPDRTTHHHRPPPGQPKLRRHPGSGSGAGTP